MIDLEKAKDSFKKYISNYDINKDKIKFKIIHMYHVAETSKIIAKNIGLSEEKQDLAELIGLLHDIGRFEQIRIYNTFSDKNSVDHGDKGVEVLFNDGFIREFITDNKYDNIINKAIKNHNKYEIESGLSEEEMLFCKIIRDADNIDIYRVLIECDKIEEFGFFGSKDISKEVLSPNYFEEFKKEKLLLYTDAKNDMDVMVAIIAHIFILNFSESLKIIKDNDYINKVINRINPTDKYTKDRMNDISIITMNHINKKINNK